MTLLATSREPLRAVGEITWQVPSLSLDDEAIELFIDRARQVRPDFAVTDDNAATVTEICGRLDGMPLAIELAAARIRALSLTEIVDSLHDRFRLLTGGARTAVRRQQTLRASVDWSHALLTEPEQRLVSPAVGVHGRIRPRRRAGGRAAAMTYERYQVLDQLTLLVDKSLVVAEDSKGPHAIPPPGDGAPIRAGEARRIRRGGCGAHPAPRLLHIDWPHSWTRRRTSDRDKHLDRAETEIDNLRAAFGWSRENGEIELALRLASSLQPLWLTRGRVVEGLGWLDIGTRRER